MTRSSFKFTLLCVVLILTLIWPFSAWAAGGTEPELLQEVRQLIAEKFVRPVDQAVLDKTNLEDMINSLNDPYSVYYTPEEYKAFQERTNGVFGGVGLQLEQVENYVVVVAPLKNTPAYRAGLKSGDILLAVNGENVVGKGLEYVVSKIRGEVGTQVVLTVQRKGVPRPLMFLLTRDNIQLEVVEYEMLASNIGYIHLSTFSRQAGKEFDNALAVLRARGMEGLIFDLRQNPGGYLSAALDIAANFAEEEEPLLYVVERDGVKESYKSLSPSLKLPVVVLVDGGSASASEIVAGAIQDLGKGKLVGTQTFGKASVQTVFELTNGGALKLTTANYMTPKERLINGIGLTPDVVVEDREAQLAKAVEILETQLGRRHKPAQSKVVFLTLNDNKAKVGEKEVALKAKPVLIKGRTLVPVRLLAEIWDSPISWDQVSKRAVVSWQGKTVSLKPGEEIALVNGLPVSLEVPAKLVDGRLFVPLRFLCETFGFKVSFDKELQQIQIY